MSTAVSIPVFLIAENRLLREALARILGKKNDITVVGRCDVFGFHCESDCDGFRPSAAI